MIAAIYSRKSTEQIGANNDEKSVTRQIEHATLYARKTGNYAALLPETLAALNSPKDGCSVESGVPTGFDGFCSRSMGGWIVHFNGLVHAT